MSTKPEALRLADLLEEIDGQHWQVQDSAAAELRRLYDLADKYKWQVIDTCARAEKAEAQRDALLEALKTLVLATKDFSIGHYNEEVHDIALSKAREAIKQAEEKA